MTIINSARYNVNTPAINGMTRLVLAGIFRTAMDDISGKRNITDELALRRQIEDYYLPLQLVESIVELGDFPPSGEETVAIGFLDISRYTFLSKFLSPKENQIMLNGMYSAFNWVLQKHGGYLNKIEGDSLMFHFGGPIDPRTREMDPEDAERHMARELFFTCVELQRVSSLFNNVNENYLRKIKDQPIVDAIREAYRILGELRHSYMSAQFNATFQIRIRIGAAIGKVLIGNFGPQGAKQWDVIGMPVIEAKRMESSAPIGGLRITSEYYDILHTNGVTKEYHVRLRREAEAMSGAYRNITFDELFQATTVNLKDKKNARFTTYSIQVNPSLPESIRDQSRELLDKRGETGAEAVVDFIKYYRGNHFVINQLEGLFHLEQINIRKDALYQIMFPGKYKTLVMKNDGMMSEVKKNIAREYSLFDLLVLLGKLQDSVKERLVSHRDDTEEAFGGYDRWMAETRASVQRKYDINKGNTHKTYYFYEVIFPMFFASIKGAILEYQDRKERSKERVADVEEV